MSAVFPRCLQAKISRRVFRIWHILLLEVDIVAWGMCLLQSVLFSA
jgi:hypothetical protein